MILIPKGYFVYNIYPPRVDFYMILTAPPPPPPPPKGRFLYNIDPLLCKQVFIDFVFFIGPSLHTRATIVAQLDLQDSLQSMLEGTYKSGENAVTVCACLSVWPPVSSLQV